ncbi:NAD(P)H-dependent oxidoreductase [Bombella sp. ESL0385]|uniref:NAD(P)H-dependent oxidoreductase n=1 Tax=Bombella sp. ESL0385 TaxID=2676446 RepID=UPI0012D9F736|nr:NAD(P)H-dependent oxidoreductase [Bombella sp. ESL0385]MUG90738.1 NADPH quinone reductase MdaB [Bombella sp. ESL0385]
MTHCHLINGAKAFAHSAGRLNQTLQDYTATFLTSSGISISQTIIDHHYSIEEEIKAFQKADIILYQFPGWWMGTPWPLKKYMDEVFTEAHGIFYKNDGRSRHDPTKLYGSGGLLQGKRFMVSTTWNAPLEAFEEPHQFFHGGGIDAVLFPFYRAHAFLGMERLPTFLATDVMKNPDIEAITTAYQHHLERVILTL